MLRQSTVGPQPAAHLRWCYAAFLWRNPMPVVLALSHSAVNAGSNRIIPSILIAGIRSDLAILYKVFGLISSRRAKASAVQAVFLDSILLAKSGWSQGDGITTKLPLPGTGEYPLKPLGPVNDRYHYRFPALAYGAEPFCV